MFAEERPALGPLPLEVKDVETITRRAPFLPEVRRGGKRLSTHSRSCGTRIDTTSVLQVFPGKIILVDPFDRIRIRVRWGGTRAFHGRP